ncbi:MAG TPA: DUF4340 domain-containing protein, partial [bacterium]|nr:DUF4340 domain-containing protein [bacterium]
AIDKKASDLRDKVVFAVTQDKIQKLDIRYPEAHGVVVSGTESEKWRIREPFDAVADWNDLNSFMGRISRLRIKEFVEESPSDLGAYGLVGDVTRLAVFEADRAEPVTLLIGRYDSAQSAYYAKHDNKPNVFSVEAPFVNALPNTAADWRPDKPLPMWDYQARTVRVERGDGTVSLELGKDESQNWILKEPIQSASAELDTNKVREFVNALQEYSIVRYATETLDPSVTGLGSPDYTVTVSGEVSGATKTYQLQIGNKVPDELLVYGKRSSDDEVFMGSISILAQVHITHEDLVKQVTAPNFSESESESEDSEMEPEPGSLEVLPGVNLKQAEPE